MEIQYAKENQEVSFIGLGKLIILILLTSCSHLQSEKSFPTINVTEKNDTVEVGEFYTAKVSLSDTSLLYLKDAKGNKERRIHPYFEINDSLFYNEKDFFEFKIKANLPKNQSLPYYQEWTCSVIFPNPVLHEGDVKLSKRLGFTIIE